MAEVPLTSAAEDLVPLEWQLEVFQIVDIFWVCRLDKTGPAAPRIVFVIREEERQIARRAAVVAFGSGIDVFPGEGVLGPFFSHHVEPLLAQESEPISLRADDLVSVPCDQSEHCEKHSHTSLYSPVSDNLQWMEQKIEARVPPAKVWEAWEKAHAAHGQQGIKAGFRAKTKSERGKGFKYQILDVVPGVSFSILWKTLFVRLIFTHAVHPTKRGSEIRYDFQIKGLFAWPVRKVLAKKIEKNLAIVLKAIVENLEEV